MSSHNMALKPGRARTAYLFGFNSTEKFEKVRGACPTNSA
jgi:hypothetical protein